MLHANNLAAPGCTENQTLKTRYTCSDFKCSLGELCNGYHGKVNTFEGVESIVKEIIRGLYILNILSVYIFKKQNIDFSVDL